MQRMSQNLFKWKHFESDIIILCVRWYLKYPLSYRMLAERGLPITHTTITELIYSGDISCKATHRMVKYLNNIVEQDHQFIKRKVKPMLGFDSLKTAEKTIAGIETMHMIRKGQVGEIQCVLSEVEFINKIMGVVA